MADLQSIPPTCDKFNRTTQEGAEVLTDLYEYFMAHPESISPDVPPEGEGREALAQRVCDFVAGMTDRFALDMYQEIFMPKQ